MTARLVFHSRRRYCCYCLRSTRRFTYFATQNITRISDPQRSDRIATRHRLPASRCNESVRALGSACCRSSNFSWHVRALRRSCHSSMIDAIFDASPSHAIAEHSCHPNHKVDSIAQRNQPQFLAHCVVAHAPYAHQPCHHQTRHHISCHVENSHRSVRRNKKGSHCPNQSMGKNQSHV